MATTSERTLEAKLNAIAEHFELGDVLDYQSAPGTNQNYLVSTLKGSYLFKIIVNTTLEEILKGLPFLQRLEEQQFSMTAYYLTSPDGDVAYHSPDCDAVVLRRLPGAMPEPSVEVCRQVGTYLAQLHLIPCENLPEKRHWMDAHYLPEMLQKATAMYGEERLSETLKIFASLRDFKPATFPQAIIHGDLDTSNCLFEGKQLVAFLDWQDVGVGAALIDFVQTVLGFCFVDQPTDSDYWALFDPELYHALYESYTSVRPLSVYELEHLDDAIRYVGLTQPVWAMTVWEQYHPGQLMVETNLLYWKYGLDKLTLPVF